MLLATCKDSSLRYLLSPAGLKQASLLLSISSTMTAVLAHATLLSKTTTLTSSTLHGDKLSIIPARAAIPRQSKFSRSGVAFAKYGEKSVYFDLEDIGNTTGAWDLYGSDAPSPYNSLQSKFFETFGGVFTKRGLLLKFLVLGGAGTAAYISSTAANDLLPIKKGPQGKSEPGPRGKI